MEMLAYLQNND